jgi:hypothetical protein
MKKCRYIGQEKFPLLRRMIAALGFRRKGYLWQGLKIPIFLAPPGINAGQALA